MQTQFTIQITRQQLSATIQGLPADECRVLITLLQRRIETLERAEPKETPQLNDFDEAFLAKPLTSFEMSKKIRSRFLNAELNTVRDVMALGADALRSKRNFGEKCWTEFYEKVLGTVRSKDDEVLWRISEWQPDNSRL